MPVKTIPVTLLALIATSLILAIHFNGSGVNISYLTTSIFLLLLAAGIAIYLNIQQHPAIPLRPCYLICGLWISWIFTSILWSQAPLASFYYAWAVSALPFGFLLWGWLKPWIGTTSLYTLIVLITLFYALWADGEFLITSQSTHGPMIYQGNFGALFAAALLPVSAKYLLSEHNKKLQLSVLFLIAVALFSTYSRGAMLSYLFTLPVLFYIGHRQQHSLKKAIPIILLSLAAYLFVDVYAQLSGGQSMSAKTAITHGQIPGVGSINARIMLWQSMLDIYRDYPVLGTGIASFGVLYPQYRNPLEDSAGYYGHNDYLQFLHEGGPLLLLFSLLPLLLIARILITTQAKTQQNNALMTAALALAAASFFIHAAADFIFYNLALALLTGFYLSLAYHQSLLPDHPAKYIIPLSQPKTMRIVFLSATALSFSILAINSFISRQMEWQNDWGSEHPQQKLDAQTLLFYHHLSPTHPSPLIRLTEVYHYLAHNESDPDKRQQAIQHALNYNFQLLQNSPRFSRYYLKLAELLQSFPQTQPAISEKLKTLKLSLPGNSLTEQLLKRAQSMDPSSEAANIALALYYQQQKQPRKALAILQGATQWFAIPKSLQSLQDQRKRLQLQKLIRQQIKQLQSKT